MSILCDKTRPSLWSIRIPLLLLVVCSCVLMVESQSSVCFANQQLTNQVSSDSTKRVWSEVYMPALLKPGMADKLISLDFDQVDIKMFIKVIGELTGINFLIDDKIRGTVTLISPTKIRVGEVYEVFESVLQVKSYAAVPAGKIVKIIPRAEASKSDILIRVGSNPALIPQKR